MIMYIFAWISLALIKILISVKMETSWPTYQPASKFQENTVITSSSGPNYVFHFSR